MRAGAHSRPMWPVAALALLAVAVAPSGALAGKKLKTKSATATVAAEESGSATATCKRGTKAVSGGFETEFIGIVPDFPFIPVESSRRSGPRDWTSSGFNNGTGEGDLTAFAYCRAQKLKTASETVTIPVGQFDTATATCPKGTKVFSGGFAAEPIDTVGTTPVLYVSESRRATKRTWEASAHSNGNEEGDLTSYVYCRSGKRLKSRQAIATISDASPETASAEFQARCKRRERVVSGGFGSPDNSGEFTPRFLASKKVGKRGWEVEAFLGSMGGTIQVTAYAYCEKKR